MRWTGLSVSQVRISAYIKLGAGASACVHRSGHGSREMCNSSKPRYGRWDKPSNLDSHRHSCAGWSNDETHCTSPVQSMCRQSLWAPNRSIGGIALSCLTRLRSGKAVSGLFEISGSQARHGSGGAMEEKRRSQLPSSAVACAPARCPYGTRTDPRRNRNRPRRSA